MKIKFVNGDVITMTSEIVNCVVVKDGIIDSVGLTAMDDDDQIDEIIDLQGNVMLPGFIDAHSHIGMLGQMYSVASLTGCKSVDEIITRLHAYKIDNQMNAQELLIGFGYDNNDLPELMHPTRVQLDQIENPVMITHQSGHMGVLNSKALARFGVNRETPNPSGGVIGKDADGELNGLLEETAIIPLFAKTSSLSDFNAERFLKRATLTYASYGITTAQDGLLKERDYQIFKNYINKESLLIDVLGYVDLKENAHLMNDKGVIQGGFKLAGYKIFLDGSPQGKTAWMKEPYIGDQDYCGYPIYDDATVVQFFRTAIDEQTQILVHCNGDAACEQMIRCYKDALAGQKSIIRPVMIHAQLLQLDQLKEVKDLGIIPSFFVAHVRYWGDVHSKNFGTQRANYISPLQSALKHQILFTLHQDTPVLMPNMLETIQIACTRETKSHVFFAQEERISVYDALKAVTINAAIQNFEEDVKGTIEQGKYADFVVLDQNPLLCNVHDIEYIQVLQTYKRGVCIYQNPKV